MIQQLQIDTVPRTRVKGHFLARSKTFIPRPLPLMIAPNSFDAWLKASGPSMFFALKPWKPSGPAPQTSGAHDLRAELSVS